MGLRCHRLRSVAAFLAVLCFTASSFAQQPKTVWGMFAGDSFSVSSVVVRSTELQQGTAAATTLETRDRCLMEYRVLRAGADGDALFDVRVSSPVRETRSGTDQRWKAAPGSQKKLDGISIQFVVDPQGSVTQFAPQDREQLIMLLSGNDPKYASVLDASCPDEVLAGWFGRVFSFPQRKSMVSAAAKGEQKSSAENKTPDDSPDTTDVPENRDTWSHTWVDSVGPFGVIRSSVQFQTASFDAAESDEERPDDPNNDPSAPPDVKKVDLLECQIKGESRFIPLVLPARAQSSTLEVMPFKSVDVKAASLQGNARLLRREYFNAKAARRPPFETIEFASEANGSAVLRENPQRGNAEQTVEFRHRETHTIVLTAHSYHGESLFVVPPPDPQ